MARPVVNGPEKILFKAYPRRWAIALLGIIGGLFAYGIALSVKDHYDGIQPMGEWKLFGAWTAVVLFGGVVPVSLFSLVCRGPSVVATPRGVSIRIGFLRFYRISWKEIADIRRTELQQRYKTARYVSIFLTEDASKEYGFDKLSWIKQFETIGEFQIGNVDVSRPLDEVAQSLRSLWMQHK